MRIFCCPALCVGFIPLLNGGTLAIMICFSCLYFVCGAGGPLSLDAVIGKKS